MFLHNSILGYTNTLLNTAKATPYKKKNITHFSPTAKAIKHDIFLVKKYRPPGCRFQSLPSFRSWNPAAINCLLASAVKGTNETIEHIID